MPLATRSALPLIRASASLKNGTQEFQSSIFNLQFIKVPSTLCSDASFASFQRLLLYSARHQHASFKASRLTAAGIPDTPPPHKQGGTLRVAALQSIMKPYFSSIYTYIYIYKYIYKYKISFRHLTLLDKQLQHCNAARNCAESHNSTNKL